MRRSATPRASSATSIARSGGLKRARRQAAEQARGADRAGLRRCHPRDAAGDLSVRNARWTPLYEPVSIPGPRTASRRSSWCAAPRSPRPPARTGQTSRSASPPCASRAAATRPTQFADRAISAAAAAAGRQAPDSVHRSALARSRRRRAGRSTEKAEEQEAPPRSAPSRPPSRFPAASASLPMRAPRACASRRRRSRPISRCAPSR